MQIDSNILRYNTVNNPDKKEENSNKSFSASMFMNQVDPEIAKIFEDISVGLDSDTKLKRALSLSLNLSSGPLFLKFTEGNYPDGMPEDLKYSMKQQNDEWNELTTDKERNIYTLDWMIDHIGHEQSDDPEFEQFLKDIRESYAGEAKSDYKSRDEINEDDAALQKFKDDLTSKGALKFLYEYNMEKIEEMVEKYKEKLLKDLGENPTPEQLAKIEKMVEDYRKELLEQLAELNDKDKNSPINISNLQNKFLNSLYKNLEDVLENY